MTSSTTNFITGTEALVELLLAQAAIDKARGINTAGFVSGYRGSPLGGFDQALWRRNKELIEAGIRFQPAINEDLGATALIGTQKVETDPERKVSGVFGMWYGKGPGVDRSGDALKHGNAYGSSAHGGVLVVAGDDHGCVSSSMSHQSDLAMIAWNMPVLHPASVADYKEVGLWGWAASRISGAWIGFKAISETVESGTTLRRSNALGEFEHPTDIDQGPDGLHWRWPDLPGPQVEQRFRYKLKAIEEFARLNPIDRVLVSCKEPHALLVTVGKAHHDVLEALRVGGLTPDHLALHGVVWVHINLVFPLSPLLQDLVPRVEHIFVVEEKAAVVETLLARYLFSITNSHPMTLSGKRDPNGRIILPEDIELRPSRVSRPLANWLSQFGVSLNIPLEWSIATEKRDLTLPKRTPYFCAGCPHSTSTLVPDGSHAQPGIGCHVMAAWMDRNTGGGSVQMGGEGVDWVGHAPFTDRKHVFQNLGDGTYFHSGHLAIRQSIAAGSNITFKILFNDAVAMTGGQPIDGVMSISQIAALALAEGAKAVAVVAEDLKQYGRGNPLPSGVSLYHRDHLELIQRKFRDIKGVTVIIYDQACATELRRRRKRGLIPQAKVSAFINDRVCEGCGDCQIQSNCLAITPIKTSLGQKRAVDQNACNSDLSCLKGFCPSFITIEGAEPKKDITRVISQSELEGIVRELKYPVFSSQDEPYDILLAGIGGTGIVTAARLLAHAAEQDGNAVSALNFSGFAQKGGEVLSHIRFCHNKGILHQVRIDRAQANLVIAADLVVGVGMASLEVMSSSSTACIANTHETQTGAMLRDISLQIDEDRTLKTLRNHCRYLKSTNANIIATHLVGDHDQANIVLLGYAWQLGFIPIRLSSMELVIRGLGKVFQSALNAFHLGRVAAVHPEIIYSRLTDVKEEFPKSLDDLIAHRRDFLSEYQNPVYANRYVKHIEHVRAATSIFNDESLTRVVAENLFRLMAYKDEYEVARLFVETDFLIRVKNQFGGKYKIRFHMSPPLWNRKDARTGKRGKITLGSWLIPFLKIIAKARFLRGTVFDLFGLQKERKMERQLLSDYEKLVDYIVHIVTPDHLSLCIQLAELPNQIRGFGYVKSQTVKQATQKKQELIAQLNRALQSSEESTKTVRTRPSGNQKFFTGSGH
ncbi:indolepyruvate ferredoxin oxidoreductase family protein [Xenorhabdus sp. Reich]|uniref:Indolepyruvate ferredoxin oxidoreductase family protein n=1 Tax=Xenorhabdus littoralis TaxID=2582835 RepID=A0ABU4SJ07_9GAMM|nr:indolepyruvate ferredoxin oxidoreductase family protein [Xenorhabdus sp. Reich]MDX7998637.1 indolepyruvate ferredoxin oxidoreductase family protein [Xenorhabdus sp. Reich]